jgi:drug/metabolite transporter (DMT)-like permease
MRHDSLHEDHDSVWQAPLLMPQASLPSDSAISEKAQTGGRVIGIALMCAALLCFSFLDATAKWLTPRIGMLETTWVRYMSSFALVSLFLNPWMQPGITVTKKPWMQVTRSLLLFASTFLNFLALEHLQLTQTMSIMFLTPLVVALLSGPLLGEWVGARRMLAIGIGFIGVLIVTRPGLGTVHPAAFYSLAGMFCYASFSILTRILSAHDSSATTMFYSGLGGLLILSPVIPFYWKTPQSLDVIAFMVLIGVFGAIGHWLMILAYRKAPAPVLSPFIYSQILWMMLLGYGIFGDVPDLWTLTGAAVVIASGLYLLHRERVTGRVATNSGDLKARI